MIYINIKYYSLWTQQSIDYNTSILNLARRNKAKAELKGNKREMKKWNKVIKLNVTNK